MNNNTMQQIKILISGLNCNTYFHHKKGEMRIQLAVAQTDSSKHSELDVLAENRKKAILTILDNVGIEVSAREDRKMYHGFLDCRYLILK